MLGIMFLSENALYLQWKLFHACPSNCNRGSNSFINVTFKLTRCTNMSPWSSGKQGVRSALSSCSVRWAISWRRSIDRVPILCICCSYVIQLASWHGSECLKLASKDCNLLGGMLLRPRYMQYYRHSHSSLARGKYFEYEATDQPPHSQL